jgi:TMEM175 potassium channel family protein
MGTGRLEAFTDGVIAIIITIMVLEVKVPQDGDLAGIEAELPLFLAYVLSFINVGIFWNNHHHMLHATERIDGRVLWANLNLLFWLSLIPFVIRWMDESGLTAYPVAAYGVVLSMAAIGYNLLQRAIIACNGRTSQLAAAIGHDFKGLLSLGVYLVSVPLAFVSPWISVAFYIAVALIWLVPDRRIESTARN